MLFVLIPIRSNPMHSFGIVGQNGTLPSLPAS